MYEIIKNVIQSGRYELTDMLTNLARSGADPTQGVDVLAKLSDLDKRLKVLENAGTTDPEPGGGISRVCNWKVVLQGRQVYI